MTSSPIPAARSQYLLDLLAQVPDPRKKRGRRHPLAGLLAAGIAAVIAGSRSFAAIGQWAADAGPEALAARGAARGPAEESTFRRTFALVSADVLDRVLDAWLHTRAAQDGGRLVIAIDGKTVRGAKDKDGKAPHLVAALAHGIGAVLGQVAVEEKSNEIPAVRISTGLMFVSSDRTWTPREPESLTSAIDLPLVAADGPERASAVTSREHRPWIRLLKRGSKRRTFAVTSHERNHTESRPFETVESELGCMPIRWPQAGPANAADIASKQLGIAEN